MEWSCRGRRGHPYRRAKVPGYYPAQVAAEAAAIGPLIQAMAGRAYKAGMPPMFAIQAATISAAQLLRHNKELGSIAPGKTADVVAVPRPGQSDR